MLTILVVMAMILWTMWGKSYADYMILGGKVSIFGLIILGPWGWIWIFRILPPQAIVGIIGFVLALIAGWCLGRFL